MTSISISLPEAIKAYVEERVAQSDYSSVDEYFLELIQQDQQRYSQEHLEALLLEGLNSGDPIAVTDEWWELKRAELLHKIRRT
jgi:antitoxin ParD1/3/4